MEMKLGKRIHAGYDAFMGKSPRSDLDGWKELANFLGLDSANTSAMSEATYFTCLKVLGESLGKIPIKLLQHTDKNGVTAARKHPLYRIINTRPNPYMTPSTFWATTEHNRNHYGNAYTYIVGHGNDMQLFPLPPESVRILVDDANLWGTGGNAVWYIYSAKGKQYRLSSEEVLHFKTSTTFDGITGLSVRDQLKATITGAKDSQKVVNDLYKKGMSGRAVLQYTSGLNDDNAKTFAEGISNYMKGGVTGVENVIPIPVGATLTPLNMNLDDAQFMELKKYNAVQIAASFGIKPYQIGDYKELSYTGAESQNLAFYVDTLLFIIKQYEEELTEKLLTTNEQDAGYHFKFNVGVILRADMKTQVETLSKAVANFIYTPNEARELLDKDAREGGDQLLGNGASIPLTMAGEQYKRNTQKPQGGDNK